MASNSWYQMRVSIIEFFLMENVEYSSVENDFFKLFRDFFTVGECIKSKCGNRSSRCRSVWNGKIYFTPLISIFNPYIDANVFWYNIANLSMEIYLKKHNTHGSHMHRQYTEHFKFNRIWTCYLRFSMEGWVNPLDSP